ncbi:hypothetical protein AV922_0207750 [Helicobacter pylori]|nr:hypothetical protein AV922_0207750 [Helicobacter pylori]
MKKRMAINHAYSCVEIFQKKKKTLFNVLIYPKTKQGVFMEKMKSDNNNPKKILAAEEEAYYKNPNY